MAKAPEMFLSLCELTTWIFHKLDFEKENVPQCFADACELLKDLEGRGVIVKEKE